eukprot:6189063-Pleurochrysis_carterae.AAC.1
MYRRGLASGQGARRCGALGVGCGGLRGSWRARLTPAFLLLALRPSLIMIACGARHRAFRQGDDAMRAGYLKRKGGEAQARKAALAAGAETARSHGAHVRGAP